LEELNPGTVVDSEADDTGRAVRVFVYPAAWQENFQHCLPVISVDGAHLKCQEGGVLFLATALTPNRDIVILAAGIAPIEDYRNWTWLIACLRRTSCNFDDPEVVIMSDREKGLAGALATILPLVPHGYCSFHIKKNVVVAFRTDLRKNTHHVAKCTSPDEYEDLLSDCKEINGAATDYLKGKCILSVSNV
jgi:hypothetical protein